MKFASSIPGASTLLLLVSCAPPALAQQPPITSAASVPTATLESTNPKTLESLGYNPAQASFYASAIKQPNVKSAYEALDGEGAIDQLNGATVASDYNSILAAAVASLPAGLQAPATSFFDGLRALDSSASGVAAATASGAASQSSAAAQSPSTRGTQTGTLLLDTTGTPSMALATGSAATGAAADAGSSAGGVTTTVTVNTATGAPSAAGASAMARPTGWVAVGAVLVGLAGVAVGV